MHQKTDPIVIASAVRTPIGSFNGVLKQYTATELGATVVQEAVRRAHVAAADIDEIIMGCVLAAGLRQAPARQAALGGGLPYSVTSTTINKMCGSGMKAIMQAHDSVLAHSADIVIAGGMESMSNAPYILNKARDGYRVGHGEIHDHMFLDGLEDAYDQGKPMGNFAEETADLYGFSREEQDAFTIESLTRAQKASANGYFDDEIVSVGDVMKDEQLSRSNIDKIPTLRPVFQSRGTITAASSSSISDGAAALIITRLSIAKSKSLNPLAIIRGHATHAQAPSLFTTAPIFATKKLMEKINWKPTDVDLYEINEAFAVVTMAAMQDLYISHDIVNINGGACALGHPIGCSGARIVVTLLAALRANNLERGIASLCIGGGEATSMAIELI